MTEYLNFLADAAAGAQARAAELQLDGRADEANFEKIRHNVFDICKTIFEALQRATPPEQFEQAYMARLRQLRATWQLAYDTAKMHDDSKKTLIEQIKLNSLQKVQLQYLELRRKHHAGN